VPKWKKEISVQQKNSWAEKSSGKIQSEKNRRVNSAERIFVRQKKSSRKFCGRNFSSAKKNHRVNSAEGILVRQKKSSHKFCGRNFRSAKKNRRTNSAEGIFVRQKKNRRTNSAEGIFVRQKKIIAEILRKEFSFGKKIIA
jgi:hypothetical protein